MYGQKATNKRKKNREGAKGEWFAAVGGGGSTFFHPLNLFVR